MFFGTFFLSSVGLGRDDKGSRNSGWRMGGERETSSNIYMLSAHQPEA